jgi:tRNA(Ile2) C34 agmatinyltransferase TiaS
VRGMRAAAVADPAVLLLGVFEPYAVAVGEGQRVRVRACPHCGVELEGRGRYCSQACRQKAARRRAAGLAEDATAGRGVPLAGRRRRLEAKLAVVVHVELLVSPCRVERWKRSADERNETVQEFVVRTLDEQAA